MEDCAAAERAATLYAQLDDRLARFMAFNSLAHMRALRSEEAATMAALEAMADAFDPAGSPIQWGMHLFTTGHALGQFGRLEEAQAVREQASKAAAELPANMSAQALLRLASAQLHAMDGRFDVALEHAQHGLDAARRLGASGRTGMLLGDMATYLVELNRPGEAVAHAREAVDVRSEDGTLWLQLDQLAQLACARGRLREAALALGRAEVHNAWRPGRCARFSRRAS
jgi:tetratricopeptide (TPR) repeat protein